LGIIIHVAKNSLEFYQPLLGQMHIVLAQSSPRQVLHIYGAPADRWCGSHRPSHRGNRQPAPNKKEALLAIL